MIRLSEDDILFVCLIKVTNINYFGDFLTDYCFDYEYTRTKVYTLNQNSHKKLRFNDSYNFLKYIFSITRLLSY